MKLPPVFLLEVDCRQRGDLSGLIFNMTVTSGTKNPYHIYFPKTSSDGKAQLTAEEFRGQFNDHPDTFPMDYNGNVETASDVVVFDLYDRQLMEKGWKDLIHWPLST